MLQRRTDLAVEAGDLWNRTPGEVTKLDGVEARDETVEGFPLTVVRVLNERGAQALGKPVGQYATLTLTGLLRREEDAFPRAVRALAGQIRSMAALPPKAAALVVGLGNRAVTPDAVGPLAVTHTMVTRHLVEQVPEHFGAFRPVAALATGVLGTTGMESGEVVRGAAAHVKPGCIIAVDALASRSMARVCTTVQIADTGIVPGSGVGNHRAALDRATLGVPVLAIGVPTVVDGFTLCADLLEEAGADCDPARILGGRGSDLFVTPRDIDASVADLAKVIGYGVNLALQPHLDIADIDLFLS